MKSSSELYFDLQKALSQAKKLEDIAADVKRSTVRRMDDVEQGLHGAWKGESAVRYLDKETAVRGQVQKTADELYSIAASVRSTAWRIYEMEMQNVRIAQSH